MKRLFEIDLKDYAEGAQEYVRPSARAIIVKEKKIALVYVANKGYYKFPGGGINEGEDMKETLIREVKEEAGLSVIPETIEEFGYVLRKQARRDGRVLVQDNYYFTCDVTDEVGEQKLDDYEARDGFELRFVDIVEAIKANAEFCKSEMAEKDVFDKVMSEREGKVLLFVVPLML